MKKIFREIKIVRTDDFTEFLQKYSEGKFQEFPHCVSAESWLLKSDLKICEIGLNVLNRMEKRKTWF